jgi:hypothetical protein
VRDASSAERGTIPSEFRRGSVGAVRSPGTARKLQDRRLDILGSPLELEESQKIQTIPSRYPGAALLQGGMVLVPLGETGGNDWVGILLLEEEAVWSEADAFLRLPASHRPQRLPLTRRETSPFSQKVSFAGLPDLSEGS